MFELLCKNDSWYELLNFLLGLFLTLMQEFSSRRNRHIVMLDFRHHFLPLVHHSVCLYNYFNIIFFNHKNVKSYVSFGSFMSCIYMFTSESIRLSQYVYVKHYREYCILLGIEGTIVKVILRIFCYTYQFYGQP